MYKIVKYIIVLTYQLSLAMMLYIRRNSMPKLLTVDEFARACGWKPATVRMKIYRRELPYVKLGRSVRLKEETLDNLIERSVVPALEAL
jgi:excisionase family DNA binding protein